jgi:hypothetical protein
MTGRGGRDLYVKVPCGTIVKEKPLDYVVVRVVFRLFLVSIFLSSTLTCLILLRMGINTLLLILKLLTTKMSPLTPTMKILTSPQV